MRKPLTVKTEASMTPAWFQFVLGPEWRDRLRVAYRREPLWRRIVYRLTKQTAEHTIRRIESNDVRSV